MLDNQIEVETPESISMLLVPAGPIPRVLAFSIDLIVRFFIILAVIFILPDSSDLGVGLYLIIYFVIDWLYSVFFEMFNNGKTPGKQAFKLQVIYDDGTPLRWGGSIMRNILRAADFLPFGYFFAFIAMCSNSGFKRIGDIAAGTLVIYQPKAEEKPQLNISGTRPVPFPLKTNEQQAIVAFAEREQQLSAARQEELAAILAPVIPQPNNNGKTITTTEQIKKIANSIVGDTLIDDTQGQSITP